MRTGLRRWADLEVGLGGAGGCPRPQPRPETPPRLTKDRHADHPTQAPSASLPARLFHRVLGRSPIAKLGRRKETQWPSIHPRVPDRNRDRHEPPNRAAGAVRIKRTLCRPESHLSPFPERRTHPPPRAQRLPLSQLLGTRTRRHDLRQGEYPRSASTCNSGW